MPQKIALFKLPPYIPEIQHTELNTSFCRRVEKYVALVIKLDISVDPFNKNNSGMRLSHFDQS
jgi:hypothetical protein